MSLKWAAQGKLDIPIVGEYKVLSTAKAFGIPTEGRTVNEVAIDLADALLEDLSRTEPDEYKTLRPWSARTAGDVEKAGYPAYQRLPRGI